MGLQIQVLNASTNREIDAVFATLASERPDALFVSNDAFFVDRRVQLALLAVLHRVPAIYQDRLYAEVGGLISYGANIADAFRHVGVYTGRILKGQSLPICPSFSRGSSRSALTPRPPGCLDSPCRTSCSLPPTR